MDNKKFHIGDLIEREVRKQQYPIVDFAEAICCKRNNVYDIFKRDDINVFLLTRISKVLNRNFFQDLADNLALISPESAETEQEAYNRKAVSQFMSVVPGILNKLGMDSTITLSDNTKDDCALPDFLLPKYGITFTIGCRLSEKLREDEKGLLRFTPFETEDGTIVDLCQNLLYGSAMLDIALVYKSENEWTSVMQFVFDNFIKKNNSSWS